MRSFSASIILVIALFVSSPTGLLGQFWNVDWPVVPGGTGVRISANLARRLSESEALYGGGRAIKSLPRAAVWVGGGFLSGEATGGLGLAYNLAESVSLDAGFGFAKPFPRWSWKVPVGITLWSETSSDIRPVGRIIGLIRGAGSNAEVRLSLVGGIERQPVNGGLGYHVGLQWISEPDTHTFLLGGGLIIGL